MAACESATSVRRRRERRLRSWSDTNASKVGALTNNAPRSEKTARAGGERPGVLKDPGPMWVEAVAAGYVAAGTSVWRPVAFSAMFHVSVDLGSEVDSPIRCSPGNLDSLRTLERRFQEFVAVFCVFRSVRQWIHVHAPVPVPRALCIWQSLVRCLRRSRSTRKSGCTGRRLQENVGAFSLLAWFGSGYMFIRQSW